MKNTIIFPNLGLEFNINPIAFSLGNITVYWYGIIIALAFLSAGFYASTRSKSFGLTEYDIIDGMYIAGPLGIICARIYYVIFSFELYKDNIIDVFKLWQGGIAIYGGVIGGALGIYIYCKMKKVHFLSYLDVGACSILLGQAIGRFGNFVNAEAYGGVTESFFKMNFGGLESYHPTFLYESVWNLIGFALLYFISKNYYKFIGQMTLTYLAWYGLGRLFIEGLRVDSLWFGQFRISQVVAFITFAICSISLTILMKKYKNETVSFPEIAEESEEDSDKNKEEKEEKGEN